jgi:hypothetical protein
MELLLPEEYRDRFVVENLEEKEESWELLAVEKKSNIPPELKEKDCVLNGYCKDIEIIDFPFRGKVMYITFRRRKWKESGYEQSYTNTYEFHKTGMKTTKEFGDFLKGLTREEYLEFFRAFPSIQYLQEENI